MVDYPMSQFSDQEIPKKYFRFLKTPEENWQPYGDTVSFKDHPYLDSYDSAEFLSNPREGHYLVVEADGSFSFSDPRHLEFYNLWGYKSMPPLQELVAKGIVVEAPEAVRKTDYDIQDKICKLSMELMDEQSALSKLEEISHERKFMFPTKEAREAKKQISSHEEKIKSITKELDALDLALNEQVRNPLLSIVKAQSKKPGFDQLNTNVAGKSVSRKVSLDMQIQSASKRVAESPPKDKSPVKESNHER